jgi:hypothetical protein
MSFPTYREMLRDPRWKAKRTIIVERDHHCCQICRCTDKTLNVHHLYYWPKKESGETAVPWDYPDSSLLTLCEDCHKEEETSKHHYDEMLPLFLRIAGARNEYMHELCTLVNELTTECEHAPNKGIKISRDALRAERKKYVTYRNGPDPVNLSVGPEENK